VEKGDPEGAAPVALFFLAWQKVGIQ